VRICEDTLAQSVLNDLQRTRISRHRMIWLLPNPFPPLCCQQDVSVSQSSCVSLVELTDRRGGVGGGGARSNDHENDWSSKIIHFSLAQLSTYSTLHRENSQPKTKEIQTALRSVCIGMVSTWVQFSLCRMCGLAADRCTSRYNTYRGISKALQPSSILPPSRIPTRCFFFACFPVASILPGSILYWSEILLWSMAPGSVYTNN
jgi:hypothetical protein